MGKWERRKETHLHHQNGATEHCGKPVWIQEVRERERVLVPPSILSVAQRGRKQEEGQGELRRGTMALGRRVPHRWSFFLLKSETTVAWEMAEVTGPDRGCSLRLGRGTKSYWSGRRGPRGEGVGEQGRQRSQGRQQEGYLVKCKTCR